MQSTRGVERVVLVLVPLSDKFDFKSLFNFLFYFTIFERISILSPHDGSNFLRRLQFKN